MKKVKYFYNTESLRYEKLEVPLHKRLLKIFGYLASTLVFAVIIIFFAQKYFPSENERQLKKENDNLKYAFKVLEKESENLENRMASLEERDNEVYRAIFESAPIPDSLRAITDKRNDEIREVLAMNTNQLVDEIGKKVEILQARLNTQALSYKALDTMINKKEELLAAIPAIQPISNKQLSRMASGFGYRIDPVYKIPKMHAGLDFAAPTGTPIYATANGKVKLAGFNDGGYGNHVIISHGYGYETLYGHMVKIKSRVGEKVKRGDIIGWVGSTGKSTGPHCHYEVHKNGAPVDPVFYFYNDLTPEQFERMLKMAAQNNQSFD